MFSMIEKELAKQEFTFGKPFSSSGKTKPTHLFIALSYSILPIQFLLHLPIYVEINAGALYRSMCFFQFVKYVSILNGWYFE